MTTSQAASPKILSPDECKLGQLKQRIQIIPNLEAYAIYGENTRIGFPLAEERVSGKGTQKVFILPIDFTDAASQVTPSDALEYFIEPKKAISYYSMMSIGELNLEFIVPKNIHRMRYNSDDYGYWNSSKTSWGLDSNKFNSEIEEVIQSYKNDFQYSSLVLLVLGKSQAWKAWGAPGVAQTASNNQYFYGLSTLQNVIFLVDQGGERLGDVFLHEFGHLLGFVDLYSRGYVGDSTGPFDVMAYHWEKSKTLLAWNLWLKGWIPDDKVVCVQHLNQASSQIRLDKIGTEGNKRMIVIKESATSVVVIEPRLNTEFDKLGSDEGILVYRVTPNSVYPEKWIQIIPHLNPTTLTPISSKISDVERYIKALVPVGSYVRTKYFLVENVSQDKSGISLSLFWDREANDRQNEIDDALNAKNAQILKDIEVAKATKAAEEKALQESLLKKAKDAQTIAETNAQNSQIELRAAKDALARSEETVKISSDSNNALKKELEKLQSDLSSFSNQIATLTNSLKSLQTSNSSLSKKLAVICKVKPKPKGC